MRKIIGHRWAIGAAALVFVFALGAISWAATTDTTSTTDGTATGPAGDPGLDGIAPGSGMLGPEGFAPGRGFSAFGRMGRLGLRGGAVAEEMKAQMEARRAQVEERRDAFIDLVRAKMSPTDQAALDSYLDTAKSQRAELEKAQEALHATNSEIRDLVGKYFPSGDELGATDSTGGTGAAGTTANPGV